MNLSDCSVYYAPLIDLGIHGRAGMMMIFDGAVTLAPDPGSQGAAAHVTSIDAWKSPILIPGARSSLHGRYSGFATLTSGLDGAFNQEQPELQPGRGFESVNFKDLHSKKKIGFSNFIADTVESSQAAAPPLKD